MQAQVLSNMKVVDEDFISKRVRRSLSQSQEGKYEFQSIFVTCDSIQDETFEFRSIYHTNICHRVFHVLALGPLTLYCE